MQDIQTSIELGVDLMKDIVAEGYSFLKEEDKKNSNTVEATKKYVSGLIERYNNVKVLGMDRPVPLKTLYVRVNILEKIRARTRLRPEDMDSFFDRDKRTFGKAIKSIAGESIINKLDKFIVLGKPGSGKTTYLRFLTLMMLDRDSNVKLRRLPIFVSLHGWAKKKMPLMDYLAEQFSACGFESADFFLKKLLERGACLILFDGLDEVSRNIDQDGIVSQIYEFSNDFSKNQFVISCRIAAYNYWFEHFTDVEIADFNDIQIEKFVKNWFRDQPKTAVKCWEQINRTSQLKEISSTPLLLILLCLSYDPEKKEFPDRRSSIYREAIKVLLEKWDESRPGGRIVRDNIYKNLSRSDKETMLARIAWGTFNEDKYFIEEEYLVRIIQIYVGNMPGYQGQPTPPDGEWILKQIEIQHGILVERAKEIYSFAHLTFQEYFAANFIVTKFTYQAYEELINNHLYDDKWQVVFLLISEMAFDIDSLALLMLRKNRELLIDPVIDDLLRAC